MKEDHAQAILDLIVVGLGAVAAVYVMRRPPLRRVVGRTAKYIVLTAVPRFIWEETKRAWQLSGSSREPGIGNRESRIMHS